MVAQIRFLLHRVFWRGVDLLTAKFWTFLYLCCNKGGEAGEFQIYFSVHKFLNTSSTAFHVLCCLRGLSKITVVPLK